MKIFQETGLAKTILEVLKDYKTLRAARYINGNSIVHVNAKIAIYRHYTTSLDNTILN